MMRSWKEVRAEMRALQGDEHAQARWEKALAAARLRYTAEKRRYRRINRLRTMYRRRKR